jgi:hypothetical protein
MTLVSETRLSEASIESRCLHRLFVDLVAVASRKKVTYYTDHVKRLDVVFHRGLLAEQLGRESYPYHRMLGRVVHIELAAGRPPITSVLLYTPDSNKAYVGNPLGGDYFTALEEFYGSPIPKKLRTDRWIRDINSTYSYWGGLTGAQRKRVLWQWARANIVTDFEKRSANQETEGAHE